MRQLIVRCDLSIMNYIYERRKQWINTVMKLITISGNAGFIWFLIAFLFVLFKKYKIAVALLLSLTIFVLLGNILLKNLIRRKRPFQVQSYKTIIHKPCDYSFPSGHAYSSFAAATVLICCCGIWAIPAVLLALAIAFSRIYFCVHYPSDIVCSLLLGIGTGILSYIIL